MTQNIKCTIVTVTMSVRYVINSCTLVLLHLSTEVSEAAKEDYVTDLLLVDIQ